MRLSEKSGCSASGWNLLQAAAPWSCPWEWDVPFAFAMPCARVTSLPTSPIKRLATTLLPLSYHRLPHGYHRLPSATGE